MKIRFNNRKASPEGRLFPEIYFAMGQVGHVVAEQGAGAAGAESFVFGL